MNNYKVLCPWCGEEMKVNKWQAYSIYSNGSWKTSKPINFKCDCGAQTPIENGIDDAFDSATNLNGIKWEIIKNEI